MANTNKKNFTKEKILAICEHLYLGEYDTMIVSDILNNKAKIAFCKAQAVAVTTVDPTRSYTKEDGWYYFK